MTRRTIVITGASDGIGAAAARRLNRSGANVVVVGRSQSKTAAVAAELNADYFVADFADLSQVRALADKVRSEYARIDVLANNAGGMFTQVHESADGHEITFQVNYLAPFLLTTQLMEVLIESRATVVNTPARRRDCFPESRSPTWRTRLDAGPARPTLTPNWQSSCSPGNYIGDTMPAEYRP